MSCHCGRPLATPAQREELATRALSEMTATKRRDFIHWEESICFKLPWQGCSKPLFTKAPRRPEDRDVAGP